MEFSTNNDRWDTTRKKYILSLKNRYQFNSNNDINSKHKDMNTQHLHEEKTQSKTTDCEDSQNFSLRLSDTINVTDIIEDSQCNNVPTEQRDEMQKSDIIVISDSSDDDVPKIIPSSEKSGSSPNTKILDSKLSQTFSSIDISDIYTDDDNKNVTVDNKNKFINVPRKNANKCSLMTSDESVTVSNNANDDESNVHTVDLITPKNCIIPLRTIENSGNSRTKPLQVSGGKNSANLSKSNITKDVNNRHNGLCDTPNSVKSGIYTTPLSKKVARDIVRAIKSKRAVYHSPTQWQRHTEVTDSESESSESNEQMNSDKKKVKHPAWINETDSESDKTPQNCEKELSKPSKTHINRFFNPIEIDSSVQLPEHKKMEISRWLMANPIDTRSDTSLSYVAPSEQNSLSSGNSSLDRLELNYETPNNRDKFNNKSYTDNMKIKKIQTLAKQVDSAKVQQTTIDSFLRKVNRDGKDISYYTPIPITKNLKKVNKSPSPDAETAELEIADCADILDKLYGDVWRDKADKLLPVSRSTNSSANLNVRAVQTERKKIVKPTKKITSSVGSSKSSNEEFNKFIRNIKPNANSTKKSNKKNWKKDDSFINDNSSSGCSDGETTYQTALTTPLISNLQNHKNKDTPMTALTMRAIEICDSDTENEETDIPVKKIIDNRRKLSFSDDEIDLRSSPGTSEYDPGDIVPPKPVIKSITTKGSKLLPKSTTITKPERIKSFLASLSPSVPLINAHPDAKKYRMDYKNNKDDLCKYLYQLYNKKIFDDKLPVDMLIEWNIRMRGTAGFCYNKTKRKTLGTVERSSRIVLATKILDSPDRLRDTLVHEMCHAATWLINEVSDGHGPFWQAWASKAMKTFPELPAIKRCHDYKITTKFTYRCMQCGYSIGRHSKSLDVERKRCGHCYGKFELLINKTTKSGTVQVKTPSNKKPSGFALFVKENYHSVKKERRDVGHKEVMQILGQQFSAIKISNKNNNVEKETEGQ